MSVSVLELPSRIDRSSWVSWACYYAGFMIAAMRVGVDDMLGDRLGLALLIASVFVFFAAVMLLQRYMRISLTSNTFGEPQHLVTSGVFRWTRNPIYLAFVVPLGALGYFSHVGAAIGVTTYLRHHDGLGHLARRGRARRAFSQRSSAITARGRLAGC